MSTWFITGSSSGLGRSLAETALRQGDNVVATARTVEDLSGLVAEFPETALGLQLDVTDVGQIARAVDVAERRFGIDVLVNNAGYGYRSAVEEGDPPQVDRLFATNFFGSVAMIKATLPAMRARRSGSIVNISSIGARTCPPGSGYYAATKAAVEAMSASLRKEVAPLGITVSVVEPGAFRTEFNGRSLQMSTTIIGDYDATVGKRRREASRVDGTQRGDPARAAAAIVAAVRSPNPPFLLVLGPDAMDGVNAEQAALRGDLDAWRQTSLGTSFT